MKKSVKPNLWNRIRGRREMPVVEVRPDEQEVRVARIQLYLNNNPHMKLTECKQFFVPKNASRCRRVLMFRVDNVLKGAVQ